jgi:UDP-N-acetylmuramoylalanine-D-glutamate ligase
VVALDGAVLVDASRLRLPGVHNRWNLCGAITGTTLLSGHPPSISALAAVVEGFEGLPSRCRTAGERGGLTFVDDALASNPFASEASIGAFPDRELTVILGGADRGVDPRGLVEALARRRPAPGVVVLPPDAERLAEALRAARSGPRADRPVVVVADLAEAVDAAVAMTSPGGVVLFSPGAPTPDGGGGYAARSRQFLAAAGFGDDRRDDPA